MQRKKLLKKHSNKIKVSLKIFGLLIIFLALVFVLKPVHRFDKLMHINNFIKCNSAVNIRNVLNFIDDEGNLRKNPSYSIVVTPASGSINLIEDFSIHIACNYKYSAYLVSQKANENQKPIPVKRVSSLDIPVHQTQENNRDLLKKLESNIIPRADLYQTEAQINEPTSNITINLYFQNPAERMGLFKKGIYLEHNTKLNIKDINDIYKINNNIIDIRLPNILEDLSVRTKESTLSPIFDSFYNSYMTENKLINNKLSRQYFYITYSELNSIFSKDLVLIVLSTLFGMILSSLFEFRSKTSK